MKKQQAAWDYVLGFVVLLCSLRCLLACLLAGITFSLSLALALSPRKMSTTLTSSSSCGGANANANAAAKEAYRSSSLRSNEEGEEEEFMQRHSAALAWRMEVDEPESPTENDDEDSVVNDEDNEDELVSGFSDHVRLLVEQEAAHYPLFGNYLVQTATSHASVPARDRVSEAWRRKLCEWCFEVVDHFNYDREVVSFALYYLDRSASLRTADSSDEPLPKREYQLLAVTALYMAIKIHGETDERDGPRRKLRIGAFVELSRGFFAEPLIEDTERSILYELDWRINPPTCLRFLASLFPLCPKWEPFVVSSGGGGTASSGGSRNSPPTHAAIVGGLYDVARYLSELSLCVAHVALECPTSVTAYASILCAMDALEPSLGGGVPPGVRRTFEHRVFQATGWKSTDPMVVRMCTLLKDICPAMFDPTTTNATTTTNTTPRHHQEEHERDNGKVSPVSVMDGPGYTGGRGGGESVSTTQHHRHQTSCRGGGYRSSTAVASSSYELSDSSSSSEESSSSSSPPEDNDHNSPRSQRKRKHDRSRAN